MHVKLIYPTGVVILVIIKKSCNENILSENVKLKRITKYKK